MRLLDGRFVCALCGSDLEVSEEETVTTIAGSSGLPNVRILTANGNEIHRCEMPEPGGP